MKARARIAAGTGRLAARRNRTILGALALCLLAFAGIGSPAAMALTVHPFLTSFGSFAHPSGVAVEEASANVFLSDSGAGALEIFGPEGGAPAGLVAPFKVEGFAFNNEPSGVAVDNSPTSASQGAVYVADVGNSAVKKYVRNPGSESYELAEELDPSPGPAFSEPLGVAVDTDGDVFVANYGSHSVIEFDPAGNETANIVVGATAGEPSSVALDAAGDLFVESYSHALWRYPANGSGEIELEAEEPKSSELIAEGATGVAADPAAGALYAAMGNHVNLYNAAGALQESFGAGHLSSTERLAVNSETGNLYVADTGVSEVALFGPAIDVTPPTATGLAVSAVDDHSAHFEAEVSSGTAGAGQETTYRFSCAPKCPGLQGDRAVATDGAPHPVSDESSELQPHTEYTVTITASNEAGSASEEATFTTDAIAPTVTTDPAQDLAPEHAALMGRVNPHNSATKYWFEYGPADCASSSCTSVPATKDATPEGVANGIDFAAQGIYGLGPATTYHYRLIAENAAGLSAGSDETFTTTSPPAESCPNQERREEQHSAFLPDCRAYEIVSPADKGGNGVLVSSTRTRAAADGSAASFTSLGGFADARGTGIAVDYLAQRSSDPEPGDSGWSTHAITPPQRSLDFISNTNFLEPVYDGEFSPNLDRGIFRAYSPIPGAAGADPDVDQVQNLYLRTDLRVPGPGSYSLLSPCSACATPLPLNFSNNQLPRFDGASADYQQVIFTSKFNLTGEAAGSGPKLYESDHGTLRLVGLVPPLGQAECGPSGPACIPADESDAGVGGSGGFYTLNTISADGHRVVFTDAPGEYHGDLYLREDHQSTIQLNVPEGGTGAGEATTRYWGASADDTRVFFTTSQQLTNDDDNGNRDLYMYEVDAPAGHHLTRLSIDGEPADPPSEVEGVIGASVDGSYVYFVSAGQLVPGAPALGPARGIYEWHSGVVSYVGELPNAGADANLDFPGTSGLTPFAARVTADGRHMMFLSHRGMGLLGYDQANCSGLGCAEVYVYSAETHKLACASCNPSGTPASFDATTNTRRSASASRDTWHLNHPLSADGRYVFFSTAEALVPEDTNDASDVYSYATETGTLHLLSSGTDEHGSYFMDASDDGRDAFFTTSQRLLGWDPDGNYDLYDARVQGGFPEPPPAAAPCAGEICQPAVTSSPQPGPFASATFSGPADPQPKRCHPGKILKHGKCVKKKHLKSHRAGRNRGGSK